MVKAVPWQKLSKFTAQRARGFLLIGIFAGGEPRLLHCQLIFGLRGFDHHFLLVSQQSFFDEQLLFDIFFLFVVRHEILLQLANPAEQVLEVSIEPGLFFF